jgi:hypothetical protein
MKGGLLSDLVTFEKPVVTEPGGYRTVTWTEDFRDWAEVQWSSELVCRFIVRYRADIYGQDDRTPASHRIIWNGKIWSITNAVADRKRTQLTIDSDGSRLVETTDLESESTEYVDGVPVLRPRSD